MAASAAGRGVKYFTFNDSKLADELTHMHKILVEWQVQVGMRVPSSIIEYSTTL